MIWSVAILAATNSDPKVAVSTVACLLVCQWDGVAFSMFSGQIERHKNTVDDKSVEVGGSQCITNLDGYSFPLKCTGGLMYLSILGKPTDEELVKYPSVHLTSIHEWDPSVLDFSYPEGDGEPVWACDPQHADLIDPNFDHQGLYTKRAINTLSSLADVHKIPPMAISSST